MIDLHTHSNVSDGSDPPARIAELAAAAGLSACALTDHDNLSGLPEARAAAERFGVRLVPGCEVSCRADATKGGSSVHVLVYFVEGDSGPLQDELRNLRADRLARNRSLVDRLAELGITVDWDELVASAGAPEGIGRPHFARALVNQGVAKDTDDAFEHWLGTGGAAYVPKARLSPIDVARLARGSGGVAVLAHPLSMQLAPGEYEGFACELAEAGFGGFESFYGRYTPEERAGLVRIARSAGLVPTGGSDYHGSFKPDLSVGRGTGDLDVPDGVLEELAARRA
ncbi:MAG: PHP domain-containing protein [Acidimicrobiales bacterium]